MGPSIKAFENLPNDPFWTLLGRSDESWALTCDRLPYPSPFIGAERHSNNVAELSGALHALELASAFPPGKIRLGYDSEYARRITTGEWRARAAARLAARARLALSSLLVTHSVEWFHIDSHTGHVLNESADRLAAEGAGGLSRWPPLSV